VVVGMEAVMRGSIILAVLFSAMMPVMLAGAVPGPFGGFGDTVESAKKTDFFTFFHLEQTGESAAKNGKVIVFQPTSDKFHALVHLYLTVDSKAQIQGAELEISRAFVDSSSDGIFARDIAKSFLQTAVDPQDADKVDNLIKEIGQLLGTDKPVLAHPDSVPKPAGAPSDGYMAYLGKRESFQLSLPHGQTLSMENPTSKPPVLKISFR
jgi:hypothetical protein